MPRKMLIIPAVAFGLALWSFAVAGPFSFFIRTYPPGSEPHVRDSWDYGIKVYAEERSPGSCFKLDNRDITVTIYDKKGHEFLREQFSLKCGCLMDLKSTWDEFKSIHIVLYEVGRNKPDPYADEYSRKLMELPDGKRIVTELHYSWDEKMKRFVRESK